MIVWRKFEYLQRLLPKNLFIQLIKRDMYQKILKKLEILLDIYIRILKYCNLNITHVRMRIRVIS